MRVVNQHTKQNETIYRWLLLGAALVVLMVVIGGITRLTQSGLSMVKWEPIMGTLPPLNEAEWNHAFKLYKQSPEFHHYNSYFVLSDFKSIFFWEYIHRLIARIIGLIFILPFFFFLIKKWFTPKLLRRVLFILLLGMFQAVLGWVMVKSGLSDLPHVSHYRLAAHLITALVLLIYIFWVALNLKYTVQTEPKEKLIRFSSVFVMLVFIQIGYGAFVAGLKGGKMYNTFPKMGSEWIPENFGRIFKREGISSLTESAGIVQFIHRILAIMVALFLIVLWKQLRKSDSNLVQIKSFKILVFSVGVQLFIGVITLLLAVPVSLGVLHQAGAIFVLLSSIFFIFNITNNHQHDNL